ncbi:TetR/AcrR family transcriptional regulator [Promicromonospora thailandica]|uniref:TetR/AcrR family transcriptional regulator n=1 Tax=Promicromonospora thailandica TaxID=765201 RepID=UPI0020A4A41D|nr:TetR/AcrR family transcriptional regulator [Promicromonospora thailandica]BFF18898.1 TetR/AcrR family transcriptional regulator [Promicromonospora thailandica]
MPTPQRADGRRRRESLLDAALDSFAEDGLLGVGIEQIRRRAGASPSSVYHHFRDIGDLTTAVLLRTFERVTAHMQSRLARAGTAEETVRTLVDSFLEWALAHPDEARFMYQAMALELSGPQHRDLLEAKARLQEPIFARLRVLSDAGDLPPWPAAHLYSLLLGAVHDACRHFLAGAETDPAWMRAMLPGAAWRSLEPGAQDDRADVVFMTNRDETVALPDTPIDRS